MAKRDLLKLRITSVEQLEQPLPPGLRATVRVALRRDDDGSERNRVVKFDVTGQDAVEDEDFAPRQEGGGA